jgi:hypothetical protein
MKPYKGKLTLRSTLRYSMRTLNEGEKEMEFGRKQRALKHEEGREPGGRRLLEIMYSERLCYNLLLFPNCLLRSGLLIAYTQCSLRGYYIKVTITTTIKSMNLIHKIEC